MHTEADQRKESVPLVMGDHLLWKKATSPKSIGTCVNKKRYIWGLLSGSRIPKSLKT